MSRNIAGAALAILLFAIGREAALKGAEEYNYTHCMNLLRQQIWCGPEMEQHDAENAQRWSLYAGLGAGVLGFALVTARKPQQ